MTRQNSVEPNKSKGLVLNFLVTAATVKKMDGEHRNLSIEEASYTKSRAYGAIGYISSGNSCPRRYYLEQEFYTNINSFVPFATAILKRVIVILFTCYLTWHLQSTSVAPWKVLPGIAIVGVLRILFDMYT